MKLTKEQRLYKKATQIVGIKETSKEFMYKHTNRIVWMGRFLKFFKDDKLVLIMEIQND